MNIFLAYYLWFRKSMVSTERSNASLNVYLNLSEYFIWVYLGLYIALDVVQGRRSKKIDTYHHAIYLLKSALANIFSAIVDRLPHELSIHVNLLITQFFYMKSLLKWSFFLYMYLMWKLKIWYVVIISIHANFAPNKCSNWLSENWKLSSERSLFAIRG